MFLIICFLTVHILGEVHSLYSTYRLCSAKLSLEQPALIKNTLLQSLLGNVSQEDSQLLLQLHQWNQFKCA